MEGVARVLSFDEAVDDENLGTIPESVEIAGDANVDARSEQLQLSQLSEGQKATLEEVSPSIVFVIYGLNICRHRRSCKV